MKMYFQSQNFNLYQGDCLTILPKITDKSINMIFADPPYFLSNNGLTVKNGAIQSVNKGEWDKFSNDNEIYTQKPLGLLSRIILSSSQKGDVILDPFSGSGTTGIASVLFDRQYIGIEQDENFLQLSEQRVLALDGMTKLAFKDKIKGQISVV